MNNKPKAVLLTLGSSLAPVIKTLNTQEPQYVCFVVSEQSLRDVQTVMASLDYRPVHHDWIVTHAAEGLSETFRAIRDDLDTILQKWDVKYEELVVDYTGGTKTMSVAVVLATIERNFKYSYVGGTERTKDGVGIVVDGKERMLYFDNPWNEMAIHLKKEVSLLFNQGRYEAALDRVRSTLPRVTGEMRTLFEWLTDAIEGYKLWDRFSHKDALTRIGRGLGKLSAYAMGSRDEGIRKTIDGIQRNREFLSVLVNDASRQHEYKILDLLANAERRAAEGKYDDALARLYRSLEAFAQSRLLSSYGIQTTNVPPELIPESIREEYVLKYKDEVDERIKIPFFAAYRLLREKGDDLGKRFARSYDHTLRALLSIRNSSILAHGFVSIKEETYRKILEEILSFAEIPQEHLPGFPEFVL